MVVDYAVMVTRTFLDLDVGCSAVGSWTLRYYCSFTAHPSATGSGCLLFCRAPRHTAACRTLPRTGMVVVDRFFAPAPYRAHVTPSPACALPRAHLPRLVDVYRSFRCLRCPLLPPPRVGCPAFWLPPPVPIPAATPTLVALAGYGSLRSGGLRILVLPDAPLFIACAIVHHLIFFGRCDAFYSVDVCWTTFTGCRYRFCCACWFCGGWCLYSLRTADITLQPYSFWRYTGTATPPGIPSVLRYSAVTVCRLPLLPPPAHLHCSPRVMPHILLR